jgi:hypothetical protein
MKKMGSESSICEHKNIKMEIVKGSNKLDYKTLTSYKPTFAHFACPDCKLNCFRKRDYYYSFIFGDTPNKWENWIPENEFESSVE